MNAKDAADIMYGEERRMEVADVKSAKRNERIGQLTKEYFNDVGTFFEWIQNIEIGADSSAFEKIHSGLSCGLICEAGFHIALLLKEYCEEKAEKDYDSQ